MNTPIQASLDYSAPAQRHSATSRAAASKIRPNVGTLQQQVLDCLRGCGWVGATDEEMQIAMEMNPSTQRPRRIELMQMGQVIDSGTTRHTKSGRSAVVWRAV